MRNLSERCLKIRKETTMFKNVNWKDLVTRAAWTFLQAFAAVWFLAEQAFDTELLVGAVGAGISAVKTFVLFWATNRK